MHFSWAADAMPLIDFFDDTMTLLSFPVGTVATVSSVPSVASKKFILKDILSMNFSFNIAKVTI